MPSWVDWNACWGFGKMKRAPTIYPKILIQVVISRIQDYTRLSPTSRAETLEGLWKRVQRSEGLSEMLPESDAAQKLPNDQNQTLPEPQGKVIEKSAADQSQAKLEQPDLTNKSQPSLETATESPPPAQPDTEPDKDLEPAALNAPVTILSGVGPRYAQNLARLGIITLRDLLYYFPRRYDDFTQLKPINRLTFGEEVTVIGTVQSVTTRNIRSGKDQIVEAVVADGTGALRITWFNQSWVVRRLHRGAHISLSGKTEQYLGRLVMNNPEWEPLEQQQLSTNRIVPVYPLTAQITQRWLRKTMNQVVMYWAPRVKDPLPYEVRRGAELKDSLQR